MKLQLQYTKTALASIYVTSLEGYDNKLLYNQIVEVGDRQNKLTNVKADMTEWQTFFPEWNKLSRDVVENHLMKLVGEMDVTWAVHSLVGCELPQRRLFYFP